MYEYVEIGWGVLPHPPYSSDLSPCDIHLFALIKEHLGGKAFRSKSNDEPKILFGNGVHINQRICLKLDHGNFQNARTSAF